MGSQDTRCDTRIVSRSPEYYVIVRIQAGAGESSGAAEQRTPAWTLRTPAWQIGGFDVVSMISNKLTTVVETNECDKQA
jgi:transcription elongation factor